VTSPDWITTHRTTPRPRGPRDPLSHALTFTRNSTRTARVARPPAHALRAHADTTGRLRPAAPESLVAGADARSGRCGNARRRDAALGGRYRLRGEPAAQETAPSPNASGSTRSTSQPSCRLRTVGQRRVGRRRRRAGAPGAPAGALRVARFGDVDDAWMHVQLRARVASEHRSRRPRRRPRCRGEPDHGRLGGTRTITPAVPPRCACSRSTARPCTSAPARRWQRRQTSPCWSCSRSTTRWVARVGDVDVSAARGARRLGRAGPGRPGRRSGGLASRHRARRVSPRVSEQPL
jgi:hypothetical protein